MIEVSKTRLTVSCHITKSVTLPCFDLLNTITKFTTPENKAVLSVKAESHD